MRSWLAGCEANFVDLKSNLALFSNKCHNFIKVYTMIRQGECNIILLNALISSLLHQEGKQGILPKAGAIKCCKEKITLPPNECCNIPF